MYFTTQCDLTAILPEIVLIVSALLILMIGAFNQPGFRSASAYSAAIACIIGAYLVFLTPDISSFGRMLQNNGFTKFAKLVTLMLAAFLHLLSTAMYQKKYFVFEFSVLLLLSTAGMLMLISASDLLTIYLSLELMTLPLYILIAVDRDSVLSGEAGIKYFILGSVASGFYLFGASLIYGFTGHTNLVEIANYLADGSAESIIGDGVAMISFAILLGMIFIISAFCFKLSAVPFHMWAPDVYQGAPTITTTIMMTAPKIASILVLVRILTQGFGELVDQWSQILTIVAIASMLIGSTAGVIQKDIKRLMAYSGIAHIGFIFVGLSLGIGEGVREAVTYLVVYITMILGVFSAILMLAKSDKYEIRQFAGIARRSPIIAIALTVLMFSMAGIPPFAGFFIKFYILSAAIQGNMLILAIVGLISSVISAYYYLKIIKAIYFDNSPRGMAQLQQNPILYIVLVMMAAFNLLYMIYPSLLNNIILDAAASSLGA